MNKNEVGLWDDVMVELHKINIGHDARGVDMIDSRGDRWCRCLCRGAREMDMHFE